MIIPEPFYSARPIWADHALFAVLAVLFPVRAGLFGFRRLRRAPEHDVPRVRRLLYRQAIAIQWTLTAIAIALWIARSRPWAALGFVPRFDSLALGCLAASMMVVAFVIWQRVRTLRSDEALGHVREHLEHVERMLPRRPDELRRFYRLSITAGVCEEVLYRGYLIWYLGHALPLWPAVVAAALLFGFGHLYQGVRGMITTFVVGLVFGALYVGTGAIWLPMVLHALADAHSGHLAYVAYAREEAALAEAAALGALPSFEAPPSTASPTPPEIGSV